MLSNGPSMLRWRPHGNHACMNRHVNRMRRACEALRCRELDGRWMQQLACRRLKRQRNVHVVLMCMCVRCLPLNLSYIDVLRCLYRCVTHHMPRSFTSMELYTLGATKPQSFKDLEFHIPGVLQTSSFTCLEFHWL